MTVYFLAPPASMPPHGLLHLLGPLHALAPPRRANRPLSDPLCIHILMWPCLLAPWHTTFLPVQPVSPAGCRSGSAVPPPLHTRRLGTDGSVLVSGSVLLYKKGRIHTHTAGGERLLILI